MRLPDTGFFNDFFEGLTAGSRLSLTFLINDPVGAIPDAFSFAIPTRDPLGTDNPLTVQLDCMTTATVDSDATDPSRRSIDLGAPRISPAPEPSILVEATIGTAAAVVCARFRRRAGRAGRDS